MTAERGRANVFTIAPHVPFLPTFAHALFDGRIMPSLSRNCTPFALARATIYVPTKRAQRALVTALSEAAGGGTLLPRIAALGALDDTDGESGTDDDDRLSSTAAIKPAIGTLERRLALTQLVHRWAQTLPGAIVKAHADGFETDDGRSLLVGTTAADAFALAGALGTLIDEFIIEGIDHRKLATLVEAEHDPYWRITTRFLEIAFEAWPNILAQSGTIDRAARRVILADAETTRLTRSGASDPVIVLGSTGTNDATARLMAAICRLPNGAVVLPGLDQTMLDVAFAAIGSAGDGPEEPGFGHPQAALKRLLGTLRVDRAEVTELAPDASSPRMAFLSDAMLPAEATDVWPQAREHHSPHLADALNGVDLLEAADEREEALAIAVRLREVAETSGMTAALITPDRTLARRVRAELARWSIAVEDSAGEPLSSTPRTVLARLLLTAAEDGTDAARLAVLAHPQARFGRDRDGVAQLARRIEIGVFRAGHTSEAEPVERVAAAREAATDRHAHRAIKAIGASEWDDMIGLLRDLQSTLAPLASREDRRPLGTWIAAHHVALTAAAGPVTTDFDGATDALFDEPALLGCALHLSLAEYRVMFDRLTGARGSPGTQSAHPRIKILGLLEARLLSADLVILAGLDETIWPPVARTDAFLNRPMRTALGLTPPERRMGQTAHDFWMAMGGRKVLLTRAKKRGGSPTTPSRFLQRVVALAGDAILPLQERGDRLAALARRLDSPQGGEVRPVFPPEPRPPVEDRPLQLSVTRIETWIRDPYSIFAERILKLSPVGGLDEAPGYAEQGTAIHGAIEWATRHLGIEPVPDDAETRLEAEADRQLAALHEDASWKAFRRPRQMRGLRYFLAYHRARQPDLDRLFGEIRGRWAIPLDDGSTFTLTGEADRIEIDRAGEIRVVDFKTGSVPSNGEIMADLAPQLTLEAAMIAAGAFPDVPIRAVAEAIYIKLGSKDGGEIRTIEAKDRSFADFVARHRALLLHLANSYRNPEQPYRSRPIAKYALKYADYDHLARVKEWSATSGVRDEF